ncbi:MAG: hypothetical protein ACKOEM_08340 [Planctomycetia bacterium]
MSKQHDDSDGHFILAAWCTVAKAWRDVPGHHASMQDAERTATDPGIYRVAYLNAGRRLDLEPFAKVPDC